MDSGKIFLLGVVIFGLIFLAGCGGEQPPQLSLSSSFEPNNIKDGGSSQLLIKVTLGEDKSYTPKVTVEPENSADLQYLTFSETSWQLSQMNYNGDVQNKRINVTAHASSTSSTFTVLVKLWVNNQAIQTQKATLTVTR